MSHPYTIALARRDFELGYLTSFQIHRSILSNGWIIKLTDGYLSEVRRPTEPRIFKSIDSVIKTLTEIGFEVNILIAA